SVNEGLHIGQAIQIWPGDRVTKFVILAQLLISTMMGGSVFAAEPDLRHQSQDREGARPHSPAEFARPRRRGDRISRQFAAPHMSAFGTKRTSGDAQPMSAFGGKADIAISGRDVCF